MKIIDNILHDMIKKGKAYTLSLDSEAIDFQTFHEIRADFKSTPKLSDPSIFSLSLGQGITADENGLGLSLTSDQTAKIKTRILYMDIKAKNGPTEEPELLLTAHYQIQETITPLTPNP
jgi:hypothetical protein